MKITYCRVWTALIIQRLNRGEKKMLGVWGGGGGREMHYNVIITREWVESDKKIIIVP